jgi:hypothetical protein
MSFGGSASAKREDETTKEKSNSQTSGSRVEQLQLDQTAINKIISDVLGSADGLASIFGAEQGVGIYNSSSAAQASGDLVTNLVGELAKITGKNVIDTDEETVRNARSDTTKNTFDVKTEASFGL